MNGEIALDTSVAIHFLNGRASVVEKMQQISGVVLPLPVVGELLFGAENSGRPLRNLTRYLQFIDSCTIVPMTRETARCYSQLQLSLKRKGKPIPQNDVWIGAQSLENQWTLVTYDKHFKNIDGIQIASWQ